MARPQARLDLMPMLGHDSQKKGLRPLALIVLALWAGLVVFAFFREHPVKVNSVLRLLRHYQPPPVPSDFLKIVTAAKHVLLACILTLAGVLAGRRILSMLGIRRPPKESEESAGESPREKTDDRWETISSLALALGLGWGLLIYAVFLLGAVGGLYTAAMWGLILLSFLVGRGDIASLFKDLGIAAGRRESEKPPPLYRLALAATCGMLLLIAIIALAPSITHDAMVYHLNVPRQYILEHGIVPIPYNLFSNTFLNIEMLYTGALLLDDFMLANLVHYTLGVAVLALLYSFARAHFGRAVATLAVLMFFFNPLVLSQMQFAYVDVGITFYFLLAFFCLWKWKCEGGRRWFFLMCVFAGIFAGTKYTSIYGLAALALATGAISLGVGENSGAGARTSGRRMWDAAKNSALFGLIVTLFVLPYLIKNYMISGNPVYPVAYNVFGGEWLVPEQVERMLAYVDSHGMGRDWRHMLALPWNITIHGKVGFDNFDATITPLWLAFLPALLLTRPNPPLVRWAALVCAAYFLSWASYTHITRYTMPIFPLLSLVSAYAVVRLKDGAVSHSATLCKAVKVGAVFLCGVVWLSFSYFFPLRAPAEFGPAVWGSQTREEFLGGKVINYGVFKYINEELPADARLVFFWDNRGYFCDRPKIGDSVIEAPTMIELLHDSGSARAFHKKLVSDGFTHVMFNRLFFTKFPTHTISEEDRRKFEADLKVFDNFLRRFCEPLFEADMAKIYALKK